MKASSFGDAVWSGVNSLVENSAMGASLDCVRNLSKNATNDALKECGINIAVTIIVNKKFPTTGKYANLLVNQFRKYPKITVAKLRKWGITPEMIYETAKELLIDVTDKSTLKIIEELTNEKKK